MSKYWLMKSEPEAFSLDDLKSCPNGTDMWDGVRNYQARNIMRDEMSIGDKVFFYHSNTKPPGIVGICEVTSESYPDPTQFNENSKYCDPKSPKDKPRWWLRDITYKKHLKTKINLDELKANPKLQGMKVIQKGQRLSVQPVTPKEWTAILDMLGETE